MYHSVYFGNINTFSDWHLVPEGRPVIAQPEPKVNSIEIPGGQGVLDLSETLTHYPTYQNRTGTIVFHALNGYGDWQTRYQNIANYLHGVKLAMYLEDDPSWWYYGRYKVKWESPNDGTWSKVSIDYDLEPLKYASAETTTNVTASTSSSGTNVTPFSSNVISMPVVPVVKITSMTASLLTIKLTNNELGITNTNVDPITIGGAGTVPLYSLPISNRSGSNTCRLNFKATSASQALVLSYRRAML